MKFKDIPIYKYNLPLQYFSQDYGLASHTTHAVCDNFIHEWRDLQCNVNSVRQISEKLSHGRPMYSQSNMLRRNCRRNIFFFSYFVLVPDLWYEVHSEAKIFGKLFKSILFALREFATNLLRGSHRRKYFFFSNLSNKPTHYLLDYGDFFQNAIHKF